MLTALIVLAVFVLVAVVEFRQSWPEAKRLAAEGLCPFCDRRH